MERLKKQYSLPKNLAIAVEVEAAKRQIQKSVIIEEAIRSYLKIGKLKSQNDQAA